MKLHSIQIYLLNYPETNYRNHDNSKNQTDKKTALNYPYSQLLLTTHTSNHN